MNGTAVQSLRFGHGESEAGFGGEAILSLADNSVLTLRNVSGINCALGGPTNGGSANTAHLTVMRIN